MIFKQIRSQRERVVAFCLALAVFFTQLITTRAFELSECHVIKYTEDLLLQKMEDAQIENNFFNVDLIKLPFENDELKQKIIAEAEGMLLIDTATEDDGCTAYVAMNPQNYEILIFTVNQTEKQHSFIIEIQAEEVKDTTVDVYSEEAVTTTVNKKPLEDISEETPSEPIDNSKTPIEEKEETTENGSDNNEDVKNEASQGNQPDKPEDTPSEISKNEDEKQSDEQMNTENPKETDVNPPEEGKHDIGETENAKDEAIKDVQNTTKNADNGIDETKNDTDIKTYIENDKNTENKTNDVATEPKSDENKKPSNIIDTIDYMVKNSEDNTIVFTTSPVLNPSSEKSEPEQSVSEDSDSSDKTSQNSNEDTSEEQQTSAKSEEKEEPSSKVDTNENANVQEETVSDDKVDSEEPQGESSDNDNGPPSEEIQEDKQEDKQQDKQQEKKTDEVVIVSEKLVMDSLNVGDSGKAEIALPSGGIGVFRTSLIVKRDNVEYLPVHLYDYDKSVTLKQDYSDSYVGPNNGVYQGIAEDNLSEQMSDGYYRFSSKRGINPFPQQFSSSNGVDMKDYYSCEFPFLVDSDGYYEYDSDKRGAKFNPATNRVELLKTTGPDFGRSLDTKKRTFGFFPFNKPGDRNPNYYFGLNLSVSFTMPKNGRINNKDMTFEFSGDDDLWVYIDGKLALDLGGIHDDKVGSINFATGEIIHESVYNAPNGRNKTVIWNLYDRNNEVSGAQRNVGINKDDYMQHTLQIFYMERGAGGSNCKMKFNIQPIPQNSLSITKEVQDVNTAIKNQDYSFTIWTKDGYYGPYRQKQLEYTVDSVKKQTDSYGRFTLKAGQTAYFDNITYARVIEDYSMEYEQKWKYAGYNMVYQGRDTGSLYVGSQNISVVFLNRYLYTQYTGSLQIEKKLTRDIEDETEFAFQIKINDTPYTGEVDIYTGNQKQTLSILNGLLRIKANQKAVITKIPHNTTYEVFELDTEDYMLKSILQNEEPHSLTEHVKGTIKGYYSGSCYGIGYNRNEDDGYNYYYGDDDDDDDDCKPYPNHTKCIKDHSVKFTNEKKVIPLGSIVVKNTIRDNCQAHGDPIFVYRLEKLEGNEVVSTIYNYIRHENGQTDQKQIVFDNLPLGTYRVVQEKTLRYIMATAKPDNSSQGSFDVIKRTFEFNLTEQNQNVGVTFINVKLKDDLFSHTDAVINDFTIDN